MRLIFVRHGESEGNAAGIIQGRLDFGLTPLGRAQAQATAEKLAAMKFDRLVSSPLKRAFETASIIAGATGHSVDSDEALAEYDMGAASGLTGPQIREKFPELIEARQKGAPWSFPGEEGRDVFNARVREFVEAFTADETVVAVAHGGVVGAVAFHVLGMRPEHRGSVSTANCAITEVERDRLGRLVIRYMNDTCHLDGLLTAMDRG